MFKGTRGNNSERCLINFFFHQRATDLFICTVYQNDNIN